MKCTNSDCALAAHRLGLCTRSGIRDVGPDRPLRIDTDHSYNLSNWHMHCLGERHIPGFQE
jgi:hypothetical protein